MGKIGGKTRNISELLNQARFKIDYYQREYSWGDRQVEDLINDLTTTFGEEHKAGNERSAVGHYGHYFLGSILISDKGGEKYIIDGQQRVTSVTLLLIYLYHQLKNCEDKQQLEDLIRPRKFGKRCSNLIVPEVPERDACMYALFEGKSPSVDRRTDHSVDNIRARYEAIKTLLPDKLDEEALPCFADWLIEKVYFIEISAGSDDAHQIFETMNDRGMPLTPTDMLKGYLLTNIDDAEHRSYASVTWRKRVTALKELYPGMDADAIKAWLHSQHAENIRTDGSDRDKSDFKRIGTEFHRWVYDYKENHEKNLSLKDSNSFYNFIQEDFDFYSSWYERIWQATQNPTTGLEIIYYRYGYTSPYHVLLAPLKYGEGKDESYRKLRIIANYFDILVARRIWTRKRSTTPGSDTMYRLIKEIRGKPAKELAGILMKKLQDPEVETFGNNDDFGLHHRNEGRIRWVLARMTDYVETQSRPCQSSRYDEYIQYEVEHIWAKDTECHHVGLEPTDDIGRYRDRIGGLLLLPKSDNSSYGSKPYADKRKDYLHQNLLAQSLHGDVYVKKSGFSGFQQFIDRTGLEFRPHEYFKKADLDARQKLYQALAEKIWDPKNLERELEK